MFLRYRSSSSPLVPRRLSVCRDFLAVAQQFRTAWVLPQLVECSVEMARFTIERKDLGVHNICHACLQEVLALASCRSLKNSLLELPQ